MTSHQHANPTDPIQQLRQIDEQRRHRLDHYPISEQPSRGETGFETYARDLARAVSAAAGGQRWHATAVAPAWPSRDIDQHNRVDITVNDHLRVALQQTNPAGGAREQWRITVNDQPIPHRVLPSEAPHQIEPIARSVWRHLNDVPVDPCGQLRCDLPATVATWGESTCTRHAEPTAARRGVAGAEPTAAPRRPPPPATPAASLPRPNTGRNPAAHSRPSGVRR